MGLFQFNSTKKNCKYVTYECEHILFLSSFQIWFALLFSFYCGHYKIFCFNILLVLTSLMHWYKPELGPRRNTDIAVLITNVFLHLYFSFNIDTFCFCLSICYVIVATTLYFIGKKLNKWSFSTFFHVFIHTLGAFTAIFVYYYAREKQINAL